MSGMIMIRRNDGIELLSDGGTFRSTSDFTITGITSKPILLPHISSVIACGGTAEISFFLKANQVQRWQSFDQMMKEIEDGLREEAANVFRYSPTRRSINAILMIGGFSTARQQWESCMVVMQIDHPLAEPKFTRFDDLWFLFAPAPTPEGLERCGFDPTNIQIEDRSTENAIRFMHAMRASQQSMGEIGDDADSAPTGSTIAGFIERVVVLHDQVITQIMWRWPDKVGEMVDTDNEGEPTSIFRAMFDPKEEEAA